MLYRKQLEDIRNTLHKEIVTEATVKNLLNGNDSEGVLHLKFQQMVKIEITYGYGEGTTVDAFIDSVDCNTGNIFGTDGNGNEVNIRYSDLSIEQLISLHEEVVVNKQYKFLQYES
jgi:hypothetical protein